MCSKSEKGKREIDEEKGGGRYKHDILSIQKPNLPLPPPKKGKIIITLFSPPPPFNITSTPSNQHTQKKPRKKKKKRKAMGFVLRRSGWLRG